MSLSSLLRILLVRWWLTALLVVVCVTAMMVISMLMPHKYTASTELIMEGNVQDRMTGEVTPSRSGYMATQEDIIRSRNVAGRVYDYLPDDLRSLVDARAAREQDGTPSPADWLARHILRNLHVDGDRPGNVMSVRLTGEDPELAAGVLNSLSEAYMDTAIELRTDPARRFSKWYQDQLDVLRGNLREARRDLSRFQQEKGIVGLSEQLDLETSRLSDLSSRLVEAQDQSTQDQLRQSQGGNVTATMADNSVIQGLRSDLARAQAELENMSTRYGERHPEYRRQRSEVEALRQSLARERRIAAGGLESTADVSRSRLEELQAAFDRQKQRVLDLKAQRDELELLQQEVQVAREAYNAASGRASANTLESRLAETNITVLNAAVAPSVPSSPNVRLNLVIATALGIFLGIALSLILELGNRRVRSRADIEDSLGIPVLAYLPGSPRVRHIREAQSL